MDAKSDVYKTDLGEIVFAIEQIKGSRKSLEDRVETKILKNKSGPYLISVVADGMGGGSEGEIAAQLTIDTILSYCSENTASAIDEMLVGAITEANSRVIGDHALNGSGSTATIVVIQNKVLYVANAGDSRAYLVRDSQLYQLTTDHTKGYLALREGKLTKEEIARWSKKDDLGIFVGQEATIKVDTRIYYQGNYEHSLELEKGDGIVLCSDGLIKTRPKSDQPYVYDKEIVSAFNREKPADAASVLISFAKGRQVDDNVSVVVISVGDVSRPLFVFPDISTKMVAIGAGIVSFVVILFLLVFIGFQMGGAGPTRPTPTVPLRSGFAYISQTSGDVQYQTANGWASLVQGEYIEVGDSSFIRSGVKGLAILDINDGSRIFIGPESGLIIASVADPAVQVRDTVIVIQNGKFIASVALRSGNTFSVQTVDQRVASVEGSIMGIQFDANLFIVDCFEGRCSISGKGQSQPLLANQYSWVDGQFLLSDVRIPNRCDEWRNMLNDEILKQINVCLPPTPTPTITPNIEATRACDAWKNEHPDRQLTPCP